MATAHTLYQRKLQDRFVQNKVKSDRTAGEKKIGMGEAETKEIMYRKERKRRNRV